MFLSLNKESIVKDLSIVVSDWFIESGLIGLSDKPKKVVLSLSGGVDSMTLLHILSEFHREGLIELVCHHLVFDDVPEHATTASLVGNACKKGDVTLVVDYVKTNGSQLTKSQCRQKIKESVVTSHGDCNLVTGYNNDDAVETALYRLLSGRIGLYDLDLTKPTTQLVVTGNEITLHKPLSLVTKSEIVEYAVTTGVEWIEDSTNQDVQKCDRNFIRHEVVPLISQRFKPDNVVKALTKMERFTEWRLGDVYNDVMFVDGKLSTSEWDEMSSEQRLYATRAYLKSKGFVPNKSVMNRIKNAACLNSIILPDSLVLSNSDKVFISLNKINEVIFLELVF